MRFRELPKGDILFFLGLLVLFLLWGVAPRALFVVTSALALGYLHFVSREDVPLHFAVGLFIAFGYLCIFRNVYSYGRFDVRLLSFPLFPLLAWPTAFCLLHYLTKRVAESVGVVSAGGRVLLGYLLYVPCLLFVEYVGYHVAGIRLESAYPSLGFLDCMHIPAPLKAVYFGNGLLFLLIVFGILEDEGHTMPVSEAAHPTEEEHSPERNE